MCVRPPCENCGADYDACYGKCPKCGHPNGDGFPGTMIPVPLEAFREPKPVEQEVPCKICKTNHKVLVMRMVD